MKRDVYTYKKALNRIGVSYVGNVAHSAKTSLSYKKGTMTYCIYLAPYTMAGVVNGRQINVCPNSRWCRDNCLNGSGHNRSDILARGTGGSHINQARVKKTRMFYEDRDLFMKTIICEIKRWQRRADLMNYEFSIRLNGTSDLSPEAFKIGGKNILELFPNVQFYDYTKVHGRIELLGKYSNYDLTFSYNGHNWATCRKFIERGGNVAVVFASEKKLPRTYRGIPVVDGNEDDMRYKDHKGVVIGLHYHRTANDYTTQDGVRVFKMPENGFVVADNDNNCDWGY